MVRLRTRERRACVGGQASSLQAAGHTRGPRREAVCLRQRRRGWGGGRRAPGSVLGGQGSAGVVAGEGGRKGDVGSGHTVSAQTPGELRQGPGCQPYRWLVMAPTVQPPVCPLLLRRPGREGTVGRPSTCPHPTCPNDTHSLLERVPWSPRILKNKMLGFVVSMTTSTQHGIQ